MDLKGGQHLKSSSSVKDKQRQTRICFQDPDAELNPNMLYPSGQLGHAGRQGSSNSGGGVNRESSQDDSGVVDDHEEQDITASEVVNVTATTNGTTTTAAAADAGALVEACSVVGAPNEHTAVTLALSPREVRLIKCNGNIARIKKHNIYALHPEDSSEYVVIGEYRILPYIIDR